MSKLLLKKRIIEIAVELVIINKKLLNSKNSVFFWHQIKVGLPAKYKKVDVCLVGSVVNKLLVDECYQLLPWKNVLSESRLQQSNKKTFKVLFTTKIYFGTIGFRQKPRRARLVWMSLWYVSHCKFWWKFASTFVSKKLFTWGWFCGNELPKKKQVLNKFEFSQEKRKALLFTCLQNMFFSWSLPKEYLAMLSFF